MGFSIWFEFENYDEPLEEEPGNDFCNIQVTLDNGRAYAFNVWSFDFLRGELETNIYLLPPDLLVQRLNRKNIETAIGSLFEHDAFPSHLEVKND